MASYGAVVQQQTKLCSSFVHAKLQNCNIIVTLLTLVFNCATKYDASVLKCVKVGTVIPMFKVLKINNT